MSYYDNELLNLAIHSIEYPKFENKSKQKSKTKIKRPNASECIRMHPNASQQVRMGRNRFEHVRKLRKTFKKRPKICESR